MTPHDYPLLFKTLIIDGRSSPGTCELSGHDRAWKWETKAARGSRGASNKLVSSEIAQFMADFFLATREQIAEWPDYARFLASYAEPNARVGQVYNPLLAVQQITEVSVVSIGGVKVDPKLGAHAQVVFTEYRPEQARAVSSASGAGGDGGLGSTRPDPLADAEAELNSLLDQASEV